MIQNIRTAHEIYLEMPELLKETFIFPQQESILVYKAAIDAYPIHLHENLEILFVLSGEIDLKISFKIYHLKKGDIVIINPLELHSIKKTSAKTEILFFEIDINFSPNLSNLIFIFNPFYYKNYYKNRISEFKEQLLMIYSEYQNNPRNIIKLNNLLRSIIHILTDHFQIQNYLLSKEEESIYKNKIYQLGRMGRILRYLYQNYSSKLTLSDIAARENISKYYLGHMIKYGTGSSLQDLINIIRIDRSEISILGTDKKIGDIIFEAGFSNNALFYKYFSSYYHTTPGNYRRNYQDQIIGKSRIKSLRNEEIQEPLKSSHELSVKKISFHLQKERTCSILTRINTFSAMYSSLDIQKEYVSALIPDLAFKTCLIINNTETEHIDDNNTVIKIFHSYNIQPIFLNATEFNSSYNNEDDDRQFYSSDEGGVFILNEIVTKKKKICPYLINESSDFSGLCLFTGEGLLTSIYYAYSFLHSLGDVVLGYGDGYIATKNNKGFQLLLFNFDSERVSDQVKRFFDIKINGASGAYVLKHYRYTISKGCYLKRKVLHDMADPERHNSISEINRSSYPDLFIKKIVIDKTHHLKISIEPFGFDLLSYISK